MNSSLISVIVPVYKVEEYLDECIKSIVNQTYKNLEIILVDDGSPDNCPTLCDNWASKDSRIKVIHKENAGAAAARNAGINVANGDYIGFVDSDDYIEKNMYEVLLEALQNTDVKISCCAAYRVYENGKIENQAKINVRKSFDINDALDNIFYGNLGTALWRRLFEKSVFEEIRLPEGETNEDYPVIVPTTVAGRGMVYVGVPLYYYRVRQGSVTSAGYMSASDPEIVYKNIGVIKTQIEKYNLPCKKSFSYFAASCSYSMAILMEKAYTALNDTEKECYKKYRKLMRENVFEFLCSKYNSAKDKILYILILTKLLRVMS